MRTAGWIIVGILTGAALSLAAETGLSFPGAPTSVGQPPEDNCTALILDRESGLTVSAACHTTGAIRLEAAARAPRRLRT